MGGELRFSITYDLADGPQVQPTLLRDYAAVHLMTCSYLASTDAVGFHRGKLFAFDLDPAEDEPIPGVERDNLFEAITITKNKLLMPEEITPMSKHQMQQTPSM